MGFDTRGVGHVSGSGCASGRFSRGISFTDLPPITWSRGSILVVPVSLRALPFANTNTNRPKKISVSKCYRRVVIDTGCSHGCSMVTSLWTCWLFYSATPEGDRSVIKSDGRANATSDLHTYVQYYVRM